MSSHFHNEFNILNYYTPSEKKYKPQGTGFSVAPTRAMLASKPNSNSFDPSEKAGTECICVMLPSGLRWYEQRRNVSG
jgi:hypothetical protein